MSLLKKTKSEFESKKTLYNRLIEEGMCLGHIPATIATEGGKLKNPLHVKPIINETKMEYEDGIAMKIANRRILLYEAFYDSFLNVSDWATYPMIYDQEKFEEYLTFLLPYWSKKEVFESDLEFMHENKFIERNETKEGKKCLIPTLKGLNFYYKFTNQPITREHYRRYNTFVSNAIAKGKERIGL